MLFTALIGPYFVDWTSWRATFEREASSYVGRPVTIAGKASVRLLPTPIVSFTDIRVGDSESPDVEMEQFRAEIELASLLKGEVRVIQTTVVRPVFRVDLTALGREGAGGWTLDPQRISLERVQITGGSAIVSDSGNGRSWRAEEIDAVLEAETLRGPAKIDATLTLDGTPLTLAAGFGRAADDDASIPLRLNLRSAAVPLIVAADGSILLAGEGAPNFSGTARVDGVEPEDDTLPRSPLADLRASGPFTLSPGALALDGVQVSYGALERPLVVEAKGAIDFGAEPRFDLTLAARQVDIDRTLGGGAEAPVSIETALASFVEAIPTVAAPPVGGRLRLEAQGMVVGGGVIQNVAATLATVADGWQVEALTATLPGETVLDLSGALTTGDQPGFRGHARLASRRPAAFASWWRGQTGSAARIGRFALEGDLDVAPDAQQVWNFVGTTPAGRMTGGFELRRAPQSEATFASVELAADRVDWDETRALAELFAGPGIRTGKLEQMTLSLRADVLSAGGIDAHDVAVEGGLEDGSLNLRRVAVRDLAGASLDIAGAIRDPFGKPSGSLEASVRAEDARGAADFLASLAPDNPLAQHLRAAAPILSPMQADVSAEGGADGAMSLSLSGSFADTHLDLKANGTGTPSDPASLKGRATLHVDGSDSGLALRQLGLSVIPVSAPPLSLDLAFDGAVADGGRISAAGTLAGMAVNYSGEAGLHDGVPSTAGAFDLDGADIDPLLLVLGLGVPGIGEGHALKAAGQLDFSNGTIDLQLEQASFRGEPVGGALRLALAPQPGLSGSLSLQSASLPFAAGLLLGSEPARAATAWPDTPFTPVLPAGWSLDLAIAAASLDIGAPFNAVDAAFRVSLADNRLTVALEKSGFAGGQLTGALDARFAEGAVTAALRGALGGAAVRALAWEREALPIADGMLDLSFDVSGNGRSLAGLVATLGGTGSFTVENGRVERLDPTALGAVMQAAEGEKEPDLEAARETFALRFGEAPFAFGSATGAFSVASGVVTVPTVSLALGDASILADARFDLTHLTLDSAWLVRTGAASAEVQPTVTLRFTGPIADPERQAELGPLLNLLQSRFYQLQIEKAEALEADRQRVLEEDERRRQARDREAAAERRDRDMIRLAAPLPADPAPPAAALPQVAAPGGDGPPDVASPSSGTLRPDERAAALGGVAIGADLPPPEAPAPLPAPPAPPGPIFVPPAPASASAPIVLPTPVPLPPANTLRGIGARIIPAPSPQPTTPLIEGEYRTLPNGTVVKVR